MVKFYLLPLVLLLTSTALFAQLAPANDDLADAIEFTLPGQLPEENTVMGLLIPGATNETDEVSCINDGSWWYTFTPTITGFYTLEAFDPQATTANDDSDTQIGVYRGTSFPLIREICSDMDNELGDGLGERLMFSLDAGVQYYFRISVAVGGQPNEVLFRISPPANEWTGDVSTDWFDTGNWSLGRLPAPSDEVTIPANATNQPLVDNGTADISMLVLEGDLTVGAGGVLNINADLAAIEVNNGATLSVAGELNAQNAIDFDDASDNDVIEVNEGLLEITSTGIVTVPESDGSAILSSDQVNIAGTLEIFDAGLDGVSLLGTADFTVAQGGDVYIEAPFFNGIFGQVTTTINVAGSLEVVQPGDNGINIEGGDLNVTSDGSITVTSPLTSGIARATLTNAGTITIDDPEFDGVETAGMSTNSGTIIVNNALDNGIDIQPNSTLINTGTIQIQNPTDAALSDGAFVNGDGGILYIDGTVTSTFTSQTGSEFRPGGLVNATTGCVTFERSVAGLAQTDVFIEIDGLALCVEYDQIRTEIGFDITNSTLDLSGDFIPQIGQTFRIIDDRSSSPAKTAAEQFTNAQEGEVIMYNGAFLQITYMGGTGNDVELIAIDEPLPVELISFTGTNDNKLNHLNWEVAAEENFSHYELERSVNGRADWTVISRMTGAGEQSYSATDRNPLQTSYYRLRMVDVDNSFSLSNVVVLTNTDATQALSVYPNPSNGSFTVSVPTDEAVIYALSDASGRQIGQWSDATALTGTTARLADGLYLLTVSGKQFNETIRVVINH